MRAFALPVVSLPWQYLTVPLGGVFIDAGSMTLAPEIVAPPPPPPPPPLPPPLLSSPPPQAAKTRQLAAMAPKPTCSFMRAPPVSDPANPFRTDIPCVLLVPRDWGSERPRDRLSPGEEVVLCATRPYPCALWANLCREGTLLAVALALGEV